MVGHLVICKTFFNIMSSRHTGTCQIGHMGPDFQWYWNIINMHTLSLSTCGIMDMLPMVSSLTMHDDGTHGPPPTFLRICMIQAVFSSLVSHDLVSNVVVYPASILRSCSSSSWTTLPPRISPSHFAVGILAFLVHRFSLLSVAFTS